jgi:hypothetical protein
LVAGVIVLLRTSDTINRTNVVGYFENSNGFYVGDDVRILGVTAGKIARSTAARPSQGLVLVRRQVQGARRCQRRGLVADAGHLARHPADPGIHGGR